VPFNLSTRPPSNPYLLPSAPFDLMVSTAPSNRFVTTSSALGPAAALMAKKEEHNSEPRSRPLLAFTNFTL
jgi:hypothetical protein